MDSSLPHFIACQSLMHTTLGFVWPFIHFFTLNRDGQKTTEVSHSYSVLTSSLHS